MKNFLTLVLGAAALCSLAEGAEQPRVTIEGLGTIQGTTSRTVGDGFLIPSRNYYSYTGIPYGTIPQRFSPAVQRTPLTKGGEVFDATLPQAACIQVPNALVPGLQTEDCLSLNVFTPRLPRNNKAPLPVIFFIHGGSFLRWSGNMWDGRRLLNKDVILVTINYRLNIFGFFTTANDAAPGNIGLYDQVLALEWVRDYISSFGGDPDRVTIAGQSAGAASVTYLLDSPLAKGLFIGAISSSGDDLAGWADIGSNSLQNSLVGAQVVGCYNPSAPLNLTLVLECMRAVPAQSLLTPVKLGYYYSSPGVQTYPLLTTPKVTPFSPFVSLVTANLHSTVPLMIGSNKNDGSFLLSRIYNDEVSSGNLTNSSFLKNIFVQGLLASSNFGISNTPIGIFDTLINTYLGTSKSSGNFSKIAGGLTDIFSVFYFKSPIYNTANGHSNVADTFVYSFDYYGTQTFYPYLGGVAQVPRGVSHVDDLNYIFYFGDFKNSNDKSVSSQMVDYYVNFATTGNPNSNSWWPPSATWPKYNSDDAKFFKINVIPTVGTDYTNYWVDASKNLPPN